MIVQKSDTNEIEIIWLGVGNCGCGVPQKAAYFLIAVEIVVLLI